ncbi:hypothetical protein [Rhodoferax sp.]|uniref:hypothetical protein n=1 Tax=Rhodoferax sp. TaxID=50421 RepID=UPI0025F98582|nr:hypothetical protein [Rhodoferax sp.]MCM2340454.1 hypothetical protein [Rhodoferax sp.]
MTTEPIEAPLLITSEEDAFRYLQLALDQSLSDKPITIEFKNWPLLTISMTGEGYDSTITSHMAQALVELQHAMNRTYARTVRGSSNPNVLTDVQKQSIEFKAKVEKGSSKITVDLGEYVSAIAQGLVGKMDGSQLVMVVLGSAVVAGSVIAYKAFLQHRSEDKKVETATQERIGLSQEETKRQAIFQQVVAAQPRLDYARQDFDDARHSIVKSVGDATSLKVQGVELSRTEARKIASTPRSESIDVQLNGNYLIDKLDWTKEGEVRISVCSTDQTLDFTAKLNTQTLTESHKEKLKAAEWGRQRLHLQINATRLRGEVTTAAIVGVEWPKDPPAAV